MVKNEQPIKVNAFIDKDTEVKGDIKFKESFRIDGKFSGKIITGDTLIIGETAQVNADIDVKNISINGRVKGSIIARETTEIFSMGRVTGQLITSRLTVEEGAFFQGTCQMELKALEDKKTDNIDNTFKKKQ